MQLELPIGIGPESIADSHWLALPYGTLHIATGPVFTHLQFGYAQVVEFGPGDGHDHHHVSPVLVDPHQQGELGYRGAVGVNASLPLIPMLTLNGQQVVMGYKPTTFVYMGGRLSARVSERLSLHGAGEFPVGSHGRYAGRGNLRVSVDL